MLTDGNIMRVSADPEYAEPFYVLRFWEKRSDGEQYYFSQWTEVVRGATDVLQVVELGNRLAAEADGPTTFAVYVIAPDECGGCKKVDLIRLFGDAPDGPIEPESTFGWTMYMDPADARALGVAVGDPREERLLRAEEN